MVLWTIYILPTEESDVKEIEIDNQQTSGEFRKKVADSININSDDLLITGKEEYNYSFNSKKMCEIDGIYDNITLFAVYQVGGGE